MFLGKMISLTKILSGIITLPLILAGTYAKVYAEEPQNLPLPKSPAIVDEWAGYSFPTGGVYIPQKTIRKPFEIDVSQLPTGDVGARVKRREPIREISTRIKNSEADVLKPKTNYDLDWFLSYVHGNPERIPEAYRIMGLRNVLDKETGPKTLSPSETIRIRKAACDEFALLAKAALPGAKVYVYADYNPNNNGNRDGHLVTVYKTGDGKLGYLSNTDHRTGFRNLSEVIMDSNLDLGPPFQGRVGVYEFIFPKDQSWKTAIGNIRWCLKQKIKVLELPDILSGIESLRPQIRSR